MAAKSVEPSISKVAFDCPHCGAYASQSWNELYADSLHSDGPRVPRLFQPVDMELIDTDEKISDDQREELIDHADKLLRGLVTVTKNDRGILVWFNVQNLNLSECFSCKKISVWIRDRLVFPAAMQGPAPNPDLPDNVRVDYDEARTILTLSPRGAAALLRLAVQKLCVELGEKGKNIDDDIASLVKKGLSSIVQKGLDSVRVIGNEAVHPGTLDLKDDVDTATKIFKTINIIAEQMISNPKHVEDLYGKIPEGTKKAIEKRDGR